MELAPSKLSDVLATPALIVVILSIDECNKLRVYCRWLLADFIDWIVRPGFEWLNKDDFWACHEMFTDILSIEFIILSDNEGDWVK